MNYLISSNISRQTTSPVLTRLSAKKEEEVTAAATDHPALSENLRTVEVEVSVGVLVQTPSQYIAGHTYLTADYQPTRVQTAEGIQRLTKNLAPFGLTKAEKLQVVNLTPVEPVELYVIVEELEDRLGNCMEEVLEIVCSSLTAPPPASSSAPQSRLEIVDETPAGPHDDPDADTPLWEHDANEIEYLDAGEGVSRAIWTSMMTSAHLPISAPVSVLKK